MVFENIKEKLKENKIIIKLKDINLNEKLYFIFFVCFVLYWFINLILANIDINLEVIKSILIIVGIISFGLMLINTKFTKKEFFIQIGMIIFLLYYFISSGKENTGILIFYPAIIGLKNVKIKDVVKVMMWTLIIATVVLVILCIFRNISC